MALGSEHTRLIVLRGNSASGKSTIAARLRAHYGRGLAVVGQDVIRRDILRERDLPGATNIGLIDVVVRYALDSGYHVVLEGILYADRYGAMLQTLRADHLGSSHFYYLDVPFAETLRRHAAKPQASAYGETEMREWFRPLDLLDDGCEQIIGPDSSLEETLQRMLADTGLTNGSSPVPHRNSSHQA
ncbi:kinase [Planomonospora sphaerica]|uniref:Kinase n=1 Tax=Planomonospora sphaerica TaxID=161355 RepID=A0A171DN39_9ACTN|nr:AAA family ATPase [Planomonospora sphaerica]GAT70480.1 kinase [Planomonospora sphaerica]